MSDRVFFDTNVLVYVVAADDRRTPAAEALVAAGGVISVQVLNEFAAVARKKLRMSWREVTAALASIRDLCEPPLPITLELHESAVQLAAKHALTIYDALIVAAALAANCTTLYSEDLRDGQLVERRVRIRNPFA